MSTGPGPTRKDDGSHGASVDEIADLLVEEDGHPTPSPVSLTATRPADDGLDVMLETPGPVLASTFMPPPPAPLGAGNDDGDNIEDPGSATNLAYEDLLAKLVLPAKSPEPEPQMPQPVPEPALVTPIPIPELVAAAKAAQQHAPSDFGSDLSIEPALEEPGASPLALSSSPSLQAAPPTEERTLVTENPLVAEEQEAAAREGRAGTTRENVRVVQAEARPQVTERLTPVTIGKPRPWLVYLMCFLGGMVFATILLKLLMSAPPAQQASVAPPAAVPQPTPAPPAQVKPLPPSPPAAPALAAPAQPEPARPAEPQATGSSGDEAPGAEAQDNAQADSQARSHRAEHKATHPRAPKPAPAVKPAAPPVAAKPAAAPKAIAPAPKPAKPAKPAKASKGGGYADPFDN